MGRYPNEGVARFDQQFAESADERNQRSAARRKDGFNIFGETKDDVIRRLQEEKADLVAVLNKIDAYWTADFPGGPDQPTETTNDLVKILKGQLAEETIVLWRTIRTAIARAENRT